jgi:stearoyl-CoA desaturase (delta-9 desaturase)
MKKVLSVLAGINPFIAAYFSFAWLISLTVGSHGIFANAFDENAGWKLAAYLFFMTHLTITAMSLCFHRAHTHKGVKFHPVLDSAMQIWLWATTSMSKLDWVSVHVYHHAHSDTPLDPHSPVQKGLARVFFLGVADYSRAKSHPDVLKIRNRLPVNQLERYIADHLFLAPIALGMALMVAFGPAWGLILMTTTFLISPIFAVGGVNALAHWFGYRNYKSTDNSRNLGFLFILNWMICGELDHNNHHSHPSSCSFRHKPWEFDIGYAYIKMLSWVGLAEIKHLHRSRANASSKATAVA